MSAYGQKYKFWVATKEQLENVIIKQKILRNIEPIEDRFAAHNIHAEMYCDYVDLVNKLGYIYHRTFQVQKRELLQRLIETAGSRLCELRNELKEIELSEYIYIDRTLVQRKLTYDMVQIIRPDFFPFVRDKEIYDLITNPRPKIDNTKLNAEEEKKAKLAMKMGLSLKDIDNKKKLTPEQKLLNDAVLLIQTHERLRVSRIWKTNIKYDRKNYLPKPDNSQFTKYEFTFKPDQSMLIPLRKTEFKSDYFRKVVKAEPFEFYSKPIPRNKFENREDEAILGSVRQKQSLTDLLKGEGNLKEEKVLSKDNDPPILDIEESKAIAARKIQRAWILFQAKRLYKKKLEERAIVYGAASKHKPIKNPLQQIFQRSYELKTIKDRYMLDFIKAVQNEETRILIKYSAGLMEDISDHIRFWIHDFYENTDQLPPFPAEVKGGTILVLLNQTIIPQEFNERKNKKPEQLAAEAKKVRNEIKKEKQKLKLKAKQEANQEKLLLKKITKEGKVYYDFEKIFTRNKFTKTLEHDLNEINNKWYYDVDEKFNYKEAPFMNWISEEKFAEVHVELRKIVDQIMRLEYEKLREAIAIDRKKKYRPPKEKKPKKEKILRKTEMETDLTRHLSIQEIFYEMQDSGLIRNYKKRCFEEFFGDFNYSAYHIKNLFNLEVMPSTLEVRDILRESILGMGPLNLPKYKSILIAGPPKSPKTQLCEILASEIDAVMIDLSIENVAKYKDDIDMLIHLVQKMSPILQPTVIFIKNIHRTFWKKVPPQFKDLNPLILSKHLQKRILKNIKETDKVIILATSNEPWAASRKMNKLFEKILLMPKTDYPSAYMLWRKFILQNPGVSRNLEISPIAWVLRNYTSGQIAENVSKTLDINRRMILSRKKLELKEFLETFLKENLFPADEKLYDKYYKWYGRANKLARKRTQVAKILKNKSK